MDPYKHSSSSGSEINSATYDYLVATDKNGKVVPYLAKSWKVTPTSVDMTVRQDATCDDGEKLTASNIAASLQRFVDPKTAANGLGYNLGNGPFTVTSSGDHVTLTSATPFGQLLVGLSGVAIICPQGLKNPSELANKAFGSGPYKLVKSSRGSQYTLERRAGWDWGPKLPGVGSGSLPKQLIYKVVVNDSTAANLFETGGLDIGQISGSDVTRLQHNSSLTLDPSRDFGSNFIVFNEAPGHVTDDELVRKGLSEAINRSDYNAADSQGRGFVTTSIYPTNSPVFDPGSKNYAPTYDTKLALADLAKAGYTRTGSGPLQKDGNPLAIRIVGWTARLNGPDYVQAALQKIGVQATLEKVSVSTLVADAGEGAFEVLLIPDQSDSPSPAGKVGYLTGPSGKSGLNWGSTKNAEAEKWIAKAGASVGDEQTKAWYAVQKAYETAYDVAPLSSETFSWFGRKPVTFLAVGDTVYPWSIRSN